MGVLAFHLAFLLDQVVQLLSELFLPELVHLEVEQEIKKVKLRMYEVKAYCL